MSAASWGEDVFGDEPFLVLNAVYLRKMASADVVAQLTALPVERVRGLLATAERDSLTMDLGGQVMLTDAGRGRVLTYYRQAYAPVRARAAVLEWYHRFETVNVQFIKLVTEWQKSDGDERVQERLVRVVEKHVAAVRDLAALVPRYERYAQRFEHGLSRIDAGDTDYVCKPTIDSVHNAWFEFHEDILAVMGQPREV